MSLSKAEFDRYHDAISRIDSYSIAELEKRIRDVWRTAGKSNPSLLSKITVEIARDLADEYGLSAGTISTALFEDIYHNDTGSRIEGILPNMEDYYTEHFGDAAEKIIAEYANEDKLEEALGFLGGIMSKAVYEWARRGQISNAQRVVRKRYKGYGDAKFARVPTGDETCAWCLMLAGRGFVYVSELSAGDGPEHTTELDRFHPYCDCLIVSSFDKDPRLEGYDPDKYLAKYEAARAYDDKGRVDLSATLHNMRQMFGYK